MRMRAAWGAACRRAASAVHGAYGAPPSCQRRGGEGRRGEREAAARPATAVRQRGDRGLSVCRPEFDGKPTEKVRIGLKYRPPGCSHVAPAPVNAGSP